MKWSDIQKDKYGYTYFTNIKQGDVPWCGIIGQIMHEISLNTSLKEVTLNVNMQLEAGMINVYPCEREQLEAELGIMFGLQFDELAEDYHRACLEMEGEQFENEISALQNGVVNEVKENIHEIGKKNHYLRCIVFTDLEFETIDELNF